MQAVSMDFLVPVRTPQTACVRNPACQAIVWDMMITDNYCWVLKSAAKPAVFNADKSLFTLDRSN